MPAVGEEDVQETGAGDLDPVGAGPQPPGELVA
jgi:hypothetical protein